jgi:predicted nuclease of predicted toxin-antitoxin system
MFAHGETIESLLDAYASIAREDILACLDYAASLGRGGGEFSESRGGHLMKILVNENIPKITVLELRAMGHDVFDIRGTHRQGLFDDDLWPFAQTEQRAVVTTDKGFSEHRDEQHYGILAVRLRQPNEQRIHARILAGFRQFAAPDCSS